MSGPPTVVVMAKAPRPGRVKTRLEPLLGPDGCARLAAALLAHTLDVAVASGFEVVVAYDPPEAGAEVRSVLPPGVGAVPQIGGDLGARMAAAAAGPLGRGRAVLVIGTDAPTLHAAALREAAGLLAGVDVVFGPAADGGYYLVGLARPVPAVFDLAGAWGGPTVLARSLDAAGAAGATVALLAGRRDLDTPGDAAALLADPDLPAGLRPLLAPDPAAVAAR